jgi:hypothetical protein
VIVGCWFSAIVIGGFSLRTVFGARHRRIRAYPVHVKFDLRHCEQDGIIQSH